MQTGKMPFLGGKDFGYMPGEAVPVPRPDPTSPEYPNSPKPRERVPGAWEKMIDSVSDTVSETADKVREATTDTARKVKTAATDAYTTVKKAVGLDEK